MIDYSILLLIVAASLSSIGGVVFGLYSDKIFSLGSLIKRQEQKKELHDLHIQEENENGDESNQIAITANNNSSDSILQQTKNIQLLEDNVKLYKFEKDLATSAIERILTASTNKTIDNYEKDRLLLKYRDQLNKLNNKMEKIQSEIDVTKLIDLRNDLAYLLDNKISDIDEKIKEINTKIRSQTHLSDLKNIKKNNKKRNDNNISNLNKDLKSSTLDDNSIEEAIDSNLKSKQVTGYKTNKNYKQKESLVNDERKRISDLKNDVLEALKRLDKAKNVKQEIEKEILTLQYNQIKPTDLIDVDKEKIQIQRQNVYRSEDENYQSVPESTITTTTTKNNIIPKIYNSLTKMQPNKSNIIAFSTPVVNTISENNNGKDKIIKTSNGNLNQKEKFDVSIKENTKNTDNQNKNTPLFRALHYSDLKKTDSGVKTKNVSIKNEDKIKTQETSSFIIKKKNNKISKFSFRSIFSRGKTERERKEEERNDSVSDTDTSRKDSLKNI
ncbi:MAG TPA: hypothetical protein VFK40_08220 [Nitrososphaeraceae archaeon]|nr:hypothetical protein [Nitrososphaeraceae archaeon]